MLSIQFTTFLALCLSFFLPSVLFALPTSHSDHNFKSLTNEPPSQNNPPTHRLHRRGLPGAVYICTADHFRGSCAWTPPNPQCHISGTGTNSARSIGPDESGYCILYEKATCTGREIATLRFPGKAENMPVFGGLRCFGDGGRNGSSGGEGDGGMKGGKEGKEATTLMTEGDPRLAGGVGSMERKRLGGVMEEMERGGLGEGMIGLRKGHYY